MSLGLRSWSGDGLASFLPLVEYQSWSRFAGCLRILNQSQTLHVAADLGRLVGYALASECLR